MIRPSGHLRSFALALLAVYFVLVLRDAWIGDDAYITLRAARNLVAGSGPVWNMSERVQAFTHPFWMLILSAGLAITRESYYTTLALTAGVAGIGTWLLGFRLAATPANAILGLSVLIFSRAHIDYTTSGLENAATHLFLVLSAIVWVRPVARPRERMRKLSQLYFLSGLLLFNRMDSILLTAPALAFATFDHWRRHGEAWPLIKRALFGFSPFIAWELFSIIYYGSFVPNTALAKLNTGIPARALAEQGIYYIFESLQADPLTVGIALLGALLGLRHRKDGLWPLSLGVLAYLAYVVKIGGDFMSGRFLTAPLMLGVCILVRQRNVNAPLAAGLCGLVALVGLSSPRSTISLAPHPPAGSIDERGIADERGYYAAPSGLLNMNRRIPAPNHVWRQHGERTNRGEVLVRATIGYFGFFATRDVFVVDPLALPEPLLARLPSRYDPNWRIGHFDRALPAGYFDSLRSGKNEIVDPELNLYYEHLRRVVRGPLFTLERFRSIWLLNTGQLDHLIIKPRFRYEGETKTSLALVSALRALDEGAALALPNAGALIDLGGRHQRGHFRIDLPSDDRYIVAFYDGEELVEEVEVDRGIGVLGSMRREIVEIPASAQSRGFTHLRVLPGMGVMPYKLGKLVHVEDSLPEEGRELAALRREASAQAQQEFLAWEAEEKRQASSKHEGASVRTNRRSATSPDPGSASQSAKLEGPLPAAAPTKPAPQL
jgi:arabinofuranosyltransferase